MSKNININIYWIRHAFSCSNMYQQFNKTIYVPFKVRDSPLTGLGILQSLIVSKKYNNIFNKADFIGCSFLKRTIQTCLYSTIKQKNKNIYILPFINEEYNKKIPDFLKKIGYKASIPMFYENNMVFFKKYLNKINSEINKKYKNKKKINIDYLKKVFKNNNDTHDFEKIKNNYNEFINIILPEIINDLIKKNPNKKTFNLCLFSHGHFIRNDVLSNLKKKPLVENTSIHKVNYTFKNNIIKNNKITKIYPIIKKKSNNILSLTKFDIENSPKTNLNDFIKVLLNHKKIINIYKDNKYNMFYFIINKQIIILTGEFKKIYKEFINDIYRHNPTLYIGNSKQNYQNGLGKNLKFDYGCFKDIKDVLV